MTLGHRLLRLAAPALPAIGVAILVAAATPARPGSVGPGEGTGIGTGTAIAIGIAIGTAIGTAIGSGMGPRFDPTRFWTLPIPAQGSPPPGHEPLTRGLKPTDCMVCHPTQFVDWHGSEHSRAFSPGLEGQLLDMKPAEARMCQTCHSPLDEQQPLQAAGLRNPVFDRQLQAAGMACAACHVRGRTRFGPPRQAGHDPRIAWSKGKPHGAAIRSSFFEDARFCATCHQFPAGAERPNGKAIENTYEEWLASPYAAKGQSCQSCHMPARRHLFGGIHDPETVAKGLTLTVTPKGATLRSTGIGHMFPTYVTPRVVFRLDALGTAGNLVVRRERVIGRVVDLGARPSREISDTRLAPGEAVSLPAPPVAGVTRLRAEVFVYPDDYYRGLYEELLRGERSARSRQLLEAALARTKASPFLALSGWRVVPVTSRGSGRPGS